MGAGRGVKRGIETSKAASISAAIETGQFLQGKYEGIKGFVRKRVEAIQETGAGIKEGFLSKIEEIKANWAKAKELRRRAKLDEMVRTLSTGIEQDESTIRSLELSRGQKKEKRAALQNELNELRGIVALREQLEAGPVSVE